MSRNFNISLVFFDDLKQFLILRYTPLMRHKTPLFKLQNPFSVWRYGGMVTVLFGRARVHTYKVLLVTMNCWHIFLVLTVTNWTKMKWKMWRVEKLNSSSWNRDTLTDTFRRERHIPGNAASYRSPFLCKRLPLLLLPPPKLATWVCTYTLQLYSVCVDVIELCEARKLENFTRPKSAR